MTDKHIDRLLSYFMAWAPKYITAIIGMVVIIDGPILVENGAQMKNDLLLERAI